jgi:polysaccharide export outer membrane protein
MLVKGLRTFKLRGGAILFLGAALAGCGLPASAPTTSQLEGTVGESGVNHVVVNIDERVADILRHYRRPTFGSHFKQRGYVPNNRLNPGDIVGISLYEVGGSSLFGTGHSGPTPNTSGGAIAPTGTLTGAATTLPPQVIEADGTVMVPYVGRVRAANRTPGQLGSDIQKQLQGKTVEPQVIVTLVSSPTSTATVGGDVGQPRAVPLTLRGERLLDVVAAAGGAKYPAYDTYVSVVRRGKIGTVLLQTVVTNASENILVRPNDQVFLTRHPRTFAVLGATSKVSQYTFDTAKVTLAEAIARAGGPIDNIGDPSGVYLFRYEPAEIAEKVLGRPLHSAAAGSTEKANSEPLDFVPMLYRIDMRKAGGYFLSQDIAMQDKDVILITNADSVQLLKLLVIVRGFTGIAYDLTRGTR